MKKNLSILICLMIFSGNIFSESLIRFNTIEDAKSIFPDLTSDSILVIIDEQSETQINVRIPFDPDQTVYKINRSIIKEILDRKSNKSHADNTFCYLAYSDFRGFKSDKPNGLVQFEFNYAFRINYSNFGLFGEGTGKEREENSLIPFYNIFGGFALTKLENKLRYKPLNYYIDTTGAQPDTIRHIHTFDLLRYANFSAFAKLNLIRASFNKGTMRFYVDFNGEFISSGVSDSLLPENDREFNINSLMAGLSFTFATKFRPENFPLNTSFTFETSHLRSYNNNVSQRTGPLYQPSEDSRNNYYPVDKELNPEDTRILKFQLLFKYNPKRSDTSGEIFLRMNYSTNSFNTIKNDVSESNYNNNYFQFQVGYVGNISDFFPAKEEAKKGDSSSTNSESNSKNLK